MVLRWFKILHVLFLQVPATLFEVRLRIVEQYFKRLNRSRTKCLRIVYSMQEFSVNLNIFY